MPGLEDLYREIILDHYRNPRNKGELATPPAHRADGMNPLCGDEIAVYLDVEGDGDAAIMKDIKIGGQGCSISQSSASMMSAAVKGKTVGQARELIGAFKLMMNIHEPGIDDDATDSGDSGDAAEAVAPAPVKLGDLEALKGVVKFPVRIKCATLAWFTMAQGLDEIAVSG